MWSYNMGHLVMNWYLYCIDGLKWGKIMVESCEFENQLIKCEFCGFTFQRCDGISCDSCPINCKTVKCPNCGYEILPESKSYKFMEDSVKKIKNRIFG